MRHSSIFFALPTTLLAAKLQDFKPRLNSLGAQCNAAYNQEVSACSEKDFDKNGPGCSKDCVKGLQALVPTVRTACANEDFGDSVNLVLLFMGGTGPQTLCKNYNSLVAVSSTPKPASQPATSSAETKTEGTSTESVSGASSKASQTASTSTESTNTSASSSATTQISTSTGLLTASSGTASSAASSPTSSPSRNSDSGGGSPFDSASGLESSATSVSITAGMSLLMTLLALCTAIR